MAPVNVVGLAGELSKKLPLLDDDWPYSSPIVFVFIYLFYCYYACIVFSLSCNKKTFQFQLLNEILNFILYQVFGNACKVLFAYWDFLLTLRELKFAQYN